MNLQRLQRGAASHHDREMGRILELPIVGPATDEAVDIVTRLVAREEALLNVDEPFRLRRTQASGLLAWLQYLGIVGNIDVGGGKTLLSFLIAEHNFRDVRGGQFTKDHPPERTMLVIPNEVYEQCTKRDIHWARRRVLLTTPVFLLGGKPPQQRAGIARAGRPGLYIVPYSIASTRDFEEHLHAIRPDSIIFDEVHYIRDPDSARGGRFHAYLREAHPRVAALSGSLTQRSLADFAAVTNHALQEHSPIPRKAAFIGTWNQVLSPGSEDAYIPRHTIESLDPLLSWAQRNFPDDQGVLQDDIPAYRRAFRLRLRTAPGVISSDGDLVGAPLYVRNAPVSTEHPDMEKLLKMIEDVDEWMLTPDEEELEWAMQKWRFIYPLTAGVYYRLKWPDGLEPEVEAQCEEWLGAALVHARAMRKFLGEKHRRGLDTPLLVRSHMARHGSAGIDADVYQTWREMHEKDFPGRPKRQSIPVRVCDYKIQEAVRWAKHATRGGKGAVIWYYSSGVGEWCVDELKKAGLDAVWCGPGKAANEFLARASEHGSIESRSLVVASMKAHSVGKNLQPFEQVFLLQWPRNAATAHQLIGRHHRPGYRGDDLTIRTCNTLEHDHQIMAACLVDSIYTQEVLGNSQKPLLAEYTPPPVMYPSSFLLAQGVGTRELSRKDEERLRERFALSYNDHS